MPTAPPASSSSRYTFQFATAARSLTPDHQTGEIAASSEKDTRRIQNIFMQEFNKSKSLQPSPVKRECRPSNVTRQCTPNPRTQDPRRASSVCISMTREVRKRAGGSRHQTIVRKLKERVGGLKRRAAVRNLMEVTQAVRLQSVQTGGPEQWTCCVCKTSDHTDNECPW